MGRLQILPDNIANMIAAGEVVQRPASVVKELVENAVDASATSVSVIVTDSGRTLIQVIDNGCGMSEEDARICFERHATSKISSAEDLHRIMTYGFRGEALASIAAVAEVTLRTRRSGDDVATQVSVAASKVQDISEVSSPVGTNVAVRNLFYNTPARRKFLKSDAVESRHIVEEFQRVALTRPDVGFSLTMNGREVFSLKPAKSLKFRVLDLLGTAVTGDIVDVEANTSILRISGYIGRPEGAKKTLGNQFFFVNGRFFRSAYLHKAVMKAYEEYIPEGVTPSYFLYLEVDPESLDVNIHPTKTEVKFEEDSVIFQILFACIKETIGKNAFGASIDFEAAAAEKEIPVLGSNFAEYRPARMPSTAIDYSYNPFEDHSSIKPDYNFDAHPDKHESYGKLFEDKVLPATQIIILHGKYIIAPAKSGMMVVHIARAQERILFDRFLHAIHNGETVTRKSLFPVKVEVGTAAKMVFDENARLLASLGFDISPFGDDALVFNGVPEGPAFDTSNAVEMAGELLQILTDGQNSLQEMMETGMAERLAKLGARSMQGMTSPIEAQRLIDELLSCGNAEFTSGGLRIITIIPTSDLEGKFNR